MEHGISGCGEQRQHTAYGNTPGRPGRPQLLDFRQDLRPPDLASFMGLVVHRVGVGRVIVNPVKHPDRTQLIQKSCQCLLLPPHLAPARPPAFGQSRRSRTVEVARRES
jgi:hypothetical protein